MKRIVFNFFFLGLMLVAQAGLSQLLSLPPNGDNQKASVSQFMGLVEVNITYNSPDVTGADGQSRDGKIWGELVPWGMVNLGFGTADKAPWRAGANENTVIRFSHDVKVEGKDIAAGSYGFHVIPRENADWTLIFSKNHSSWGSFFYNPDEDALRVDVKPIETEFTEWLTFGFEDRLLNSTTAYLAWERMKIPFKIQVEDLYDIYLAKIRDDLRSSTGFTYLSYMQAANFCSQNKINLDEGLAWANAAISAPFVGEKNFQTLQAKANVLMAMDKMEEADATMDEAVRHPTAAVGNVHQYARGLIAQGRNEKALEIFTLNQKLHPDEKFTTYVGLGRGYAAVGDVKNAIKNWEIAIKNIPEDQKQYMNFYEAELNKLKEQK